MTQQQDAANASKIDVSAGNFTRAQVKELYLGFLKAYKFTPSEVWLGAGSALIMYGLRDHTDDLDAGATLSNVKRAEHLVGRKAEIHTKAEGFKEDGTLLLPFPDFALDLHSEPAIGPDDLQMVDGVNCHSLKSVLLMKLTLNRPKDQADIKNIIRILAKEL